ncbi:trypsin-like peptidase domain-containing protein [Leisingera methylohalidivorans]|uniref:Peptidoglycan-binding protein n=1 Tax=Leisingera methylohalidivorans DSM 14336 TaxID=999552 RepID=V9VW39_9RHOB|nr:trypsin-like peptidase domain-containing protein [Leisingera methylohalidivorans]AHD01585.1 peptidoglycan-binding protein [Leisingera methylohalidivorans DSM 14336]
MKKLFAALALPLIALAIAFTAPVSAQSSRDAVWVQIAARPSLREAETEARTFAARLPDVSGYALGGGWYGVVLGPYARDDAERVLQVYRAEGQIPRDSFIAFRRNLGNQFYPLTADATAPAQPAPAPAPAAPAAEDPAPQQQAALQSNLPDETPAEARRSERALSREQRMQLQVALKAAGFYNSGIDGAFGRGTRRSMSDWQSARGFEPTGVLTTGQRQVLMDEYNAPLISVGMARVEDAKAGIALQIPAGEVAFDRYESPFAHYAAKGDLGAEVLLISQPGDKRTLFGLYDILQTLEIVPLEGPRQRGKDSFTIEGRNSNIVSFTQASLKNGEVKGFTLIWPAGDEDRRTRVLAAMQASFTRLDGVLDPAAGGDTVQNIDLVSGLEIRKPKLSRSGFFVDSDGSVLTTSDVVAGCTRITLDHGYQAEVAANNIADGIAILRPAEALAPAAVAELSATSPRLQSEVAVSGFSYEGVLGAPSLTWGKVADVKSLDGNTGVARLELTAQPGDAGGPVLDSTGAVLGMLLPRQIEGKQLPEDVRFAVNAEAIRGALNTAGLSPAAQSASAGSLPNAALTRLASGMTVLVSCWE